MGDETMIDGRQRVVIERVRPLVDAGRFAVKRVLGDTLTVGADAFADGHDELAVRLLHLRPGALDWHESPMAASGNDEWHAQFPIDAIGVHRYLVAAWIDRFTSWRRDLARRVDAGQDVAVDLVIGARLVDEAVGRASGTARARLVELAGQVRADDRERAVEAAVSDDLAVLMAAHPDRRLEARSAQYELVAEPRHAATAAWYELFPRSTSAVPGRHGTLLDVVDRLPYVAGMGFDVLYLPPVHPIGRTFRKGPNNTLEAGPGRSGRPVGDRITRGRAHGGPPGARHHRGPADAGVRGHRSRHPDRPGPRLPGIRRPPAGDHPS